MVLLLFITGFFYARCSLKRWLLNIVNFFKVMMYCLYASVRREIVTYNTMKIVCRNNETSCTLVLYGQASKRIR
jgi:hypothetical protein